MSALVIDTSSWVDYFAGRSSDESVIDDALDESRAFLPPIVAAELLSGSFNAKDREALRDFLSDLPWCVTDQDHWFRVGQLRAELRKKGVTISTPDAHVAQCAIDLQAALLSRDGIFKLVAQHAALQLFK